MKTPWDQWVTFQEASIIYPEQKAIFHLPILAINKNPTLYQLDTFARGIVTEVNESQLGLVTQEERISGGKLCPGYQQS